MKRSARAFLFLFFLCSIAVTAVAAPDFNKAIKIGSGCTMVIEYTDPDCPFCRKGSEFFRTRRDVTRYIFLNPLSIHPQAKEKAEFILSAPDKAKAYEEVLSGKLDGQKLTGITEAGKQLLEYHMATAQEAKVDSTPTFIIDGRIIEGFNKEKLEAILGK